MMNLKEAQSLVFTMAGVLLTAEEEPEHPEVRMMRMISKERKVEALRIVAQHLSIEE